MRLVFGIDISLLVPQIRILQEKARSEEPRSLCPPCWSIICKKSFHKNKGYFLSQFVKLRDIKLASLQHSVYVIYFMYSTSYSPLNVSWQVIRAQNEKETKLGEDPQTLGHAHTEYNNIHYHLPLENCDRELETFFPPSSVNTGQKRFKQTALTWWGNLKVASRTISYKQLSQWHVHIPPRPLPALKAEGRIMKSLIHSTKIEDDVKKENIEKQRSIKTHWQSTQGNTQQP